MTKMQRSLTVVGIGLGMNLSGRFALLGSHPLIGNHSPTALHLFAGLWLITSGIVCFVGGIQVFIAGGGFRAIFSPYKKKS